MIVQDETRRFVTDAEKTTWNNKAPNTHATQSAAGLMSPEDKEKLDNLDDSFVTLDTEQEITKKKFFKKGIKIISPKTQDEPGIQVTSGDGTHATIMIGNSDQSHYTGFYLNCFDYKEASWRESNPDGSYTELAHPRKSGVIAVTSDLASKVSSSQVKNIAGPMSQAEYNVLTPDANTLYIITD